VAADPLYKANIKKGDAHIINLIDLNMRHRPQGLCAKNGPLSRTHPSKLQA
jgi:hypothetical protein